MDGGDVLQAIERLKVKVQPEPHRGSSSQADDFRCLLQLKLLLRSLQLLLQLLCLLLRLLRLLHLRQMLQLLHLLLRVLWDASMKV